MKRIPALTVAAVLAAVLAIPLGARLLGAGAAVSPSPQRIGGEATPTAGSPASSLPATPGPSAAEPVPAAPSPTRPPATVQVAIVPVTQFRSPYAATSIAEVKSVLAGTSGRYDAVELVTADADAVLAAVGAQRPSDARRLVLAPSGAVLSTDLAAHRKRLAFLRADDVGPTVRTLAWGRHALFGVDRVATLDEWPLTIPVPAIAAPGDRLVPYDPATAWTLVAGGDIMLDRGVYRTVRLLGKGVNFPFDGGTARITGHSCCSGFGWVVPQAARTGNKGAVRDYLQAADLAIANFENPAPNRFRYHTSGTVFSADPGIIDGLSRAGIDWVSIANNHIRDAGGNGILETIANLDKRGIAHGGAGKNLAAARTPSILEAGGIQVGIIGYDAIAATYWATATRIGSAHITAAACREDVAKARRAGADVVIVFPHWGIEYRATPSASQRRLAQACIDAGADMIIGNHAHWAAAFEVYKGKPVWYALGNLVFDQTWSEPTMEGITLELTFRGADLLQARMRPHIILDKAQPNFLDPAGDGKVVMNQLFAGSRGLLDW